MTTSCSPIPLDRYNALMDVVSNRLTNRAFDPEYVVPDEHYKLILDAARHGPSGANAQPWHYIVIKNPEMKERLGDTFNMENYWTEEELNEWVKTKRHRVMYRDAENVD